MKKALTFAGIGETLTGLGLLIVPSLVSWLLLGTELSGVSIPLARVTGIALIGLGISCWPGRQAINGMLTYSALVTPYLGYIAVRGELVGILLWPAVVLHAILCLLLALACLKQRRKT